MHFIVLNMFCITVYRPLSLVAAAVTYVLVCYWLIKNMQITELEPWQFVMLMCLVCGSTLHCTFEILLNFYHCCLGLSHGKENCLLRTDILFIPTFLAAS